MKLLITRLISVFFLTIMSISVIADASVDESQWQLEKQDDELGIKVYTREVAGSDLRAFRGEMTITSTLTAPIALLEDTRRAPDWMHNCGIVEIIESIQPGEALSYVITKAPWPVSDRDTVVHSIATQDPDTLVVRVDVSVRNDVFPANDEFVRITQMSGYWLFSPAKSGEKGTLDVVYEVHAEPNGGLPSWLANSVVVDTPYFTLKNMQKLLQAEHYQQAELSFIRNR